MKSCPSCGTSNDELAPSCVSCGTAFGTIAPTSSYRSAGGGSTEATQVSADPDLVGGRYRLIEQLGKGGAGVVYRAWDTKLEEDTAIKILQQDAAADGAEIGRFKREITTARKITHPNVIRIHDFGESGRDVFISMEILTGGTLGRMMKAGLPISEALTIAIGVCEGVQAAHGLGIVHRDLKPDNILFDADGRPKVADFGLARLQMASTRTVGFSGTPFYMSPEHANGSEVTTRSDVYSLGIVFYQLFTGRLPFTADNFLRLVTMHCNEAPPPMRQIAPALPVELERVILKALEKDPKKRHANAGELGAELKRVPVPQGTTANALVRSNPDLAQSLRMTGPVPMPVRELSASPPPSRTRVYVLAGFGLAAVAAGLAVATAGSGLLSGPGRTAATPAPTPTLVVAAPSATRTEVAVAPITPDPTPTLAPTPAATATPAPTRAHPTPVRTPAPVRTPTPAPTKVAVAASLGFLNVAGTGFFEVWIDGVKVGIAPFDQEVKPGSHLLKLVAPGPPAKVKTYPLSVTAGKRYALRYDIDANVITPQK